MPWPKLTSSNLTETAWLIDIFDWDIVSISENFTAVLSFPLNLCVDFFPCTFQLHGAPRGGLTFSTNGTISCLSKEGCSQLTVCNISIDCGQANSIVSAKGSVVRFDHSSFTGCSVSGAIRSMIELSDEAKVMFNSCTFVQVDEGRSLFTVAHVSIKILNSSFYGCLTSENQSMFQLYNNARVFIEGASFTVCNTSNFSPTSMFTVESSELEISNATFSNVVGESMNLRANSSMVLRSCSLSCKSWISSSSVILLQASLAEIWDSSFENCRSDSDGALIRALDLGQVRILSSEFQSIHSGGFGGVVATFGGILSINNSHFINCTSVSGGAVWVSSIQVLNSVITLSYSSLDIVSSTFKYCNSNTIGVQNNLSLGIQVMTSCQFKPVLTKGFGGAIAIFGSSTNALILDSKFLHCASSSGGGAVWVSAFEGCYSYLQPSTTRLFVDSSVFQGCRTDGDGGAVLAKSGSSSFGDYFLEINISFSTITDCSAANVGGGISMTGFLTDVSIEFTNFSLCTSGVMGGALSAANSSSFSLISCTIVRSVSNGLGGGAMHAQESFISIFNTTIESCSAPSGGGGVLFWQGRLLSRRGCPRGTRSIFWSCLDGGNSACYIGNCSLCDAGAYQAYEDSENCSLCPPGTYSENSGSAVCLSCSAGHYSTAIGATSKVSCYACEKGFFSVSGASMCLYCAIGTYSDVSGASACVRCLDGYYSTEAGASSSGACIGCRAGKFSLWKVAGFLECKDCSVGKYSEMSGFTESTSGNTMYNELFFSRNFNLCRLQYGTIYDNVRLNKKQF